MMKWTLNFWQKCELLLKLQNWNIEVRKLWLFSLPVEILSLGGGRSRRTCNSTLRFFRMHVEFICIFWYLSLNLPSGKLACQQGWRFLLNLGFAENFNFCCSDRMIGEWSTCLITYLQITLVGNHPHPGGGLPANLPKMMPLNFKTLLSGYHAQILKVVERPSKHWRCYVGANGCVGTPLFGIAILHPPPLEKFWRRPWGGRHLEL